MTNTKIIYMELIEQGFSDNQLMDLMEAAGGDLPFHTFQEWKNRGYSVKKGEQAMFSVKLWHFTNKPNMAARKAAEERGEEINEDPHYFLKRGHIFGFEQVKRIETGDPHPLMKLVTEDTKTEDTFMAPVVYKKPCTALAII